VTGVAVNCIHAFPWMVLLGSQFGGKREPGESIRQLRSFRNLQRIEEQVRRKVEGLRNSLIS